MIMIIVSICYYLGFSVFGMAFFLYSYWDHDGFPYSISSWINGWTLGLLNYYIEKWRGNKTKTTCLGSTYFNIRISILFKFYVKNIKTPKLGIFWWSQISGTSPGIDPSGVTSLWYSPALQYVKTKQSGSTSGNGGCVEFAKCSSSEGIFIFLHCIPISKVPWFCLLKSHHLLAKS